MNLTSLNRVKSALGVTKSDQDGTILRLIHTASNRIAYHLRRLDALQSKSRVEYSSPYAGQRVFRTRAYPIASVASIYVDSTGLFTGSQALIPSTDYIVAEDGRTIIFNTTASYTLPYLSPFGNTVYPKSVKITYTAGLAADPVISSWTKGADAGGALTVGKIIVGNTSQAMGILTAAASGTLSYECLYGVFVAETVTEYDRADRSMQDGGPKAATGVTAALTAVTSQSLAEAYPDLAEAVEMHVRYLLTNRNSFENINVVQDGVTRISRSDLKHNFEFLPEVRAILDTHQSKVLAP